MNCIYSIVVYILKLLYYYKGLKNIHMWGLTKKEPTGLNNYCKVKLFTIATIAIFITFSDK